MKDYYLSNNCSKSTNYLNLVDPIYSDKYILKFNGSTVASSTDIQFINKSTSAVLDDTAFVYIGMSSFLRDNRGKDYFYKYATHSEQACVDVKATWNIKHPASPSQIELDGHYGDAFSFIYSVRTLGNYDSSPEKINNPMIDLTDSTSIYKFDVTEHYRKSA